MGTISKDTFKRLFLLYTIGEFDQGSYGKLRLEKIVYFIERDSDPKSFEYKWCHYGQYSDDLSDTLDQLISMGYVTALTLDTGMGAKYVSTVTSKHQYYGAIINKVKGFKKAKIREIVEEWGYKSEDEIKNKAYSFKETKDLHLGEIIFKSNIPDRLVVKGFKEDDCEEIELAFNPNFVVSIEKIVMGIEETDFDIRKVKRVDKFF